MECKKQSISLLVLFASNSFLFSQNMPSEYHRLVKKADSLYTANKFQESATFYSEAFKVNGWKGSSNDRYNAACSWAMAKVPDSAFFQLERIADKAGFKNYRHISTDSDLTLLHDDKRWNPLLEKVKENKEKSEANLNKTLVARLDSIYEEDQTYRLQLDELEKKYDWSSKEIKAHWAIIRQKDSINLIKVKSILDTYGWLGPEVVGEQGNTTLFLVIQHSNPLTQERYLPMMREAVKNKKARASSLALLEDRVLLAQGKRQIYGSQMESDLETKIYYVSPLEDPDNVDKRRAEVGLEPLAKYVARWEIIWDVEQYKKDLPQLEEKRKRR